MARLRRGQREKPLHSCEHLSPVSQETDSALTGVYDLLLLHNMVGRNIKRQTDCQKEDVDEHRRGYNQKHTHLYDEESAVNDDECFMK